MLGVVFRRHLRAGVGYEDYVDAWRAEKGYGVRARVLNATALDDERQVLTIGFVAISTHAMKLAERFLRHHDRSRHDRIEDVVDAPPLVARYEAVAEHHIDPSGRFRAVHVGSRESMLRFAHGTPSGAMPDPEPVLVLAAARRLPGRVDRAALGSARTPPSGGGVHAVLIDLRGVDDDRELLSVLFTKGTQHAPSWAQEWIGSGLGAQIRWSGEFRIRDEHDFQKEPIAVPLGSTGSVLAW